jgi:glucose-6-phosphate isomerase
MQTSRQLWERFQKYYSEYPDIGLALDISRMNFADGFLESMEPKMAKAFSAMAALENGAIANPDENRMVGHYWLRNAALAPTPAIRREIEETIEAIKAFAREVHSGKIQGQKGLFKNLLLIGIGGSALGPRFVANALGHPKRDKLKVFFFDNTDPDGMQNVLASLDGELGQTLCIVISKSGGTKETRNGMLEAGARYERAGLNFALQSVAITGKGSELDNHAAQNGWIRRFPMWDWIGGRTSETSAVGLLPAALQGFDVDGFLAGASACDQITRQADLRRNPAALLALMWFYAGDGKGSRDMVVLPYKDRIELFSRYLQQLIMESLGKEKDLDGKTVHQGLSVYGNKGSTDQHAYIQQLRDGLNNFFAVFIEVLEDQQGAGLEVEPNVTSGDFLSGFFLGTRRALYENGRESVTLTLKQVNAKTVGTLIALFERTVGFYATLVNVNAYDQPGVEAGKKAAAVILRIQHQILDLLRLRDQPFSAAQIAAELKVPDEVETVFKVCEHLAANQRGIKKRPGSSPVEAGYQRS